MTDPLQNPIVAIALIAVVSILILWGIQRSEYILDTWAKANGYKIIKEEWVAWRWDSYFLTTPQGVTVYRVTVVDSEGRQKNGMVRCGHWLFSILVNTATVKWDE